MIDDDYLITLWSLAGMELWAEFQRNEAFRRHICLDSVLLQPINIVLIGEHVWFTWYDVADDYPDRIILYVIEDMLSFAPDERWWKLLFAKHWYERNNEQFNDG